MLISQLAVLFSGCPMKAPSKTVSLAGILHGNDFVTLLLLWGEVFKPHHIQSRSFSSLPGSEVAIVSIQIPFKVPFLISVTGG